MADKFRRTREPRHIRLYHSITGSEAWLHLSGNSMKVLIALARFNDGKNNGELYFSERTGAKETGLSRNTVKRCLQELIEKGFIVQTKPGAFNRNNLLAATYRLTWVPWPGGKPSAPTRDFEKWKPENSQAQSLTPSGSNFDTSGETGGQGGSIPDTPTTGTSDFSGLGGGSNNGPQVCYQGGRSEQPQKPAREQANSLHRANLAVLRNRVLDHLQSCDPGEQSRVAAHAGVPGATLSKFVNGGGLPERYHEPLSAAVTF